MLDMPLLINERLVDESLSHHSLCSRCQSTCRALLKVSLILIEGNNWPAGNWYFSHLYAYSATCKGDFWHRVTPLTDTSLVFSSVCAHSIGRR